MAAATLMLLPSVPPPLSASARSWARSWAMRDATSSSEKEEEGAASEAAAGAIVELLFLSSGERERRTSVA